MYDPHSVQRLFRLGESSHEDRVSAWIFRIIFNRLVSGSRKRLLDLGDGNLIGIAFLFRVQRHTIPASLDERPQTIKHMPTLLNRRRSATEGVSPEPGDLIGFSTTAV